MTKLDPLIIENFFGKSKFFMPEFIQSQLNERKGLQRDLYERSLNGLEYLAQLRDAGLNPIFKGGSAVQVLLPETIQRLSLDIDLAVDEKEPEILEFLEIIHNKFNSKIYSYEVGSGKHPDFFQLYFVDVPSFLTDTNSKLRLDVLFHKPKYRVEERKLKTFLYDSDIKVEIPTIDSLIGDKLTVLAPETIGKPMKKPLQYSKQLYDISSLLERSIDFQTIYHAYMDVFEFEKKTHKKDQLTPIQTLDDLINICKLYTLTLYTPKWITESSILEKITFLKHGIRRIEPFLSVGLRFTFPKARRDASKIAFLGTLLKLHHKKELTKPISMNIFQGDHEVINQLYRNIDYMRKVIDKIKQINPIKRSHIDPKQFFKTDPLGLLYWYGYFYPFDFLDDIFT